MRLLPPFLMRKRKEEQSGDRMAKNRIGEILIKYGWITEAQLRKALDQQRESPSKRTGAILMEAGLITPRQLYQALGEQMELEVIDLGTYPVDRKAVEMIPRKIAVKYHALAVEAERNNLTVAVDDPMNLYALEDIRLVTKRDIRLVLADRESIDKAIDIYYAEVDARIAATRANRSAEFSDSAIPHMEAGLDDDPSPIVHLLNTLLWKGYNTNVSDIHIEPHEKETIIRMRRDGMLLPYMTLAPVLHLGLVARTKILAQMDIAQKMKPQDGHFKISLDGVEINIRVSFVPTEYGEKGVLRFLDSNTRIDYGQTFGMNRENYGRMMEILQVPNGIIYLTGPTGSGKTTTLYSILQYLCTLPVNIMTIEDPVEKNIPGINQVQVNEKAGITFETGLRSLLRQDPDVIMVGETRDYETAVISVRAAITGHLVFSTLHTNDTASTVTRLLDMGIPGYQASSALAGIVAQRLVRKICPYCRERYMPDARERSIIYGKDDPGGELFVFRGRGCYLCDDTGYKGRVAVHEIMGIDSELRRMISEGKRPEELTEYAVRHRGMSTLKDDVRKLVLNGVTSVEEMKRMTFSLDSAEKGEHPNGDAGKRD